jgi:peptidoglycan/LPS O-acetylase OafA/YrhL
MHQVLQLLRATPQAIEAGLTPIIPLTSVWALLLVELCVYAAATLLFFTVERPFLQLRRRIAPRKS